MFSPDIKFWLTVKVLLMGLFVTISILSVVLYQATGNPMLYLLVDATSTLCLGLSFGCTAAIVGFIDKEFHYRFLCRLLFVKLD